MHSTPTAAWLVVAAYFSALTGALASLVILTQLVAVPPVGVIGLGSVLLALGLPPLTRAMARLEEATARQRRQGRQAELAQVTELIRMFEQSPFLSATTRLRKQRKKCLHDLYHRKQLLEADA